MLTYSIVKTFPAETLESKYASYIIFNYFKLGCFSYDRSSIRASSPTLKVVLLIGCWGFRLQEFSSWT